MEYYIATAKDFCENLEQLHTSEPDINNRAIKAAKLIKKTLGSFRTMIRKEGFRSTEDEIHFFKYVKPKISSYLIFYSVLSEIESSKITMNAEELKQFIDKKERMFRHIMRENIEFVQYYRNGLCHLDKIYFVREANLLSMSKNTAHQLTDPEFNVSHDLVAANIMAFDLFQKHLSPKPEMQPSFGPPKPKTKWTGSKTDIVELIYALHASGRINHGEADLKEIQEALELIFHVKIDDLYRSFIDIANRKKEQIKFVSLLDRYLRKRIEEQNKLF